MGRSGAIYSSRLNKRVSTGQNKDTKVEHSNTIPVSSIKMVYEMVEFHERGIGGE